MPPSVDSGHDAPQQGAEGVRPSTLPIPRLLMLCPTVPVPPDRGDRIRAYHLLQKLHRHFRVSLAAFSPTPLLPHQHQALDTLTQRYEVIETHPLGSRARGAAGFAFGRSYTAESMHHPALHEVVRRWHDERPFDAVLVLTAGMARYAAEVVPADGPRNGAPRPRLVLDLVDVVSAKLRKYADLTPWTTGPIYRMEARRLRALESGSGLAGGVPTFDAVTVCSIPEAEAFRMGVCDERSLRVVTNGVDTDYFEALPDPNNMTALFTGRLDYRPNREGLRWFLQRVWPVVAARLPAARLLVAGANVPRSLQRLARGGSVEFMGHLSDIRQAYAVASVVINPIRLAPGIQNKVLEAMACQRPVVCAFPASRGIDAEDGRHFLVADTHEDFADHLIRLFKHPSLRHRLAEAARRRVRRRHRWDAALAPMVELLRNDRGEAVAAARSA